MRVVEGLRRTRYALTCFFAGRNEEEARLETARSARGFSRSALAVIDDKLTFSAALMRAGEVRAAYRMMEEAEADVVREESVLFERVNEVAAAGSTPRARMTRLRLARILASACLMAGSVFGLALAGAIVDRLTPDARAGQPAGSAPRTEAPPKKLRSVEVAPGVKVALDKGQLRTFRAIRDGKAVSGYEVEMLLASMPPDRAGAFLTNLSRNRITAFLAHLPSGVASELREAYGIADELVAVVKDNSATATGKSKSRQESEKTEPASESEEAEASKDASESPNEADPQPSGDGSKVNDDDSGRSEDHDGEIKIDVPDLISP